MLIAEWGEETGSAEGLLMRHLRKRNVCRISEYDGKKLVIGKLVTPLGLLLTEWKVYVVRWLPFLNCSCCTMFCKDKLACMV